MKEEQQRYFSFYSTKTAGEKAIETKKRKTIEEIEKVKVKVEHIKDYKKLKRLAIDDYNEFKISIDRIEQTISYNTQYEDEFINRVIENFVRHNLTNYDFILYDKVKGKVGCNEAYDILREKITNEIYKVYPFLKQDSVSHD